MKKGWNPLIAEAALVVDSCKVPKYSTCQRVLSVEFVAAEAEIAEIVEAAGVAALGTEQDLRRTAGWQKDLNSAAVGLADFGKGSILAAAAEVAPGHMVGLAVVGRAAAESVAVAGRVAGWRYLAVPAQIELEEMMW